MGMYILLTVMIIIVCLLIMAVVLVQNPKGGGLSSQFGGSGGAQVMGVKKTSDLLEKLTWYFAIAILVMALSTKFFITTEGQVEENSLIESIQDEAVIPQQPVLESNDAAIDAINDLTEGDTAQ